jgi:hypothetical protein
MPPEDLREKFEQQRPTTALRESLLLFEACKRPNVGRLAIRRSGLPARFVRLRPPLHHFYRRDSGPTQEQRGLPIGWVAGLGGRRAIPPAQTRPSTSAFRRCLDHITPPQL